MTTPRFFRQARFTTSARELTDLPVESAGEIAFAGRSNAGKSSALNTLTDHRQLAFVSKTPGRTQLINYFDVGGGHFLVDLPGDGYAKIAKSLRAPWGKILGDYVLHRESLRGLALIMDIRHPLFEYDLLLLDWFRPTLKPVHVLLTKADKLSRGQANQTMLQVRKALLAISPDFSVQLFSSLKKTGIEEAEAVFAGWLGLAPPEPAVASGGIEAGAKPATSPRAAGKPKAKKTRAKGIRARG